MKVALALNFPPDDHRLVYARGISKELTRRGHSVSLVVQKGKGITDLGNREPYELVGLPGSTYGFSGQLLFMWRLFLFLRKRDWDIIHARNPFSSVLPPILLRKLGHKNAAIIYDIRGLWIDTAYLDGRFGPLSYFALRRLEGLVMSLVDRIITISDRLKAVLARRGISPDQVDVVFGDGVDISMIPERQMGKNRTRKVIGYLGSITKSRNPDEILEAFRIAQDRSSIPLELVLVGPVENGGKELRDLARDRGIGESVRVTGPMPHVEALNELSKFDIALSYDSSDSLPHKVAVHTKVFEYLAAGLPIVATKHPIHEGILDQDVNAILTDPNPASFADGIMRAVSNEALCQRIGQNAKRTAFDHQIGRKADQVMASYKRARASLNRLKGQTRAHTEDKNTSRNRKGER